MFDRRARRAPSQIFDGVVPRAYCCAADLHDTLCRSAKLIFLIIIVETRAVDVVESAATRRCSRVAGADRSFVHLSVAGTTYL